MSDQKKEEEEEAAAAAAMATEGGKTSEPENNNKKPKTSGSQDSQPSPLALLAATCSKIGTPGENQATGQQQRNLLETLGNLLPPLLLLQKRITFLNQPLVRLVLPAVITGVHLLQKLNQVILPPLVNFKSYKYKIQVVVYSTK
uniref:cDNA FLJ57388, moderately similar to Transcription factor Sp4 n=1 Tax=Homo sapiens TaxID=9606 RepID=B4DKX0_HUMAN|nr:unnamed protein product [Homo sapiens]